MIATEILVMLVAIVGMSMTTIGVVIALFVRLDRRIADLDAKVDGVYYKLDGKIGNLERDGADLKVAVARVEGYLEARDGLTTAAVDPAPPSVPVE